MRRVAGAHTATATPALSQEDAQIVAERKLAALLRPSLADRIIEAVMKVVGCPAFVEFNLLWIGCWLIINLNLVPGVTPFDPYPFSLLMLILPTEALFLVLLTAVNRRRLRHLADKLARLDALANMMSEDEERSEII